MTVTLTPNEAQTVILALSTAIEKKFRMLEVLSRGSRGGMISEIQERERHAANLTELRKKFQLQ